MSEPQQPIGVDRREPALADGHSTLTFEPRVETVRQAPEEVHRMAGDDGRQGDGLVTAKAPPGYELLGVLGQGGMGVVFKARQIRLQRVVAIKMILTRLLATPTSRDRFRTEAEAVARLQHPNIVQIFETGEDEENHWFSMEYCAGGSLDRRLKGQPMAAREAAELVEKLARALAAAHQKGIIHRDLKPANILLTEDGVPKVSDFGLAKKLDDQEGHTATDAIMGTPAYMAPEQASGQTVLAGPAADVYALGAILYECLTGRPPFHGANWLEVIDQVRKQEPDPPRKLNPHVPRELEAICLKCLRKIPTKRHASAADLADELHRFLVGVPLRGDAPERHRAGTRLDDLAGLLRAADPRAVLVRPAVLRRVVTNTARLNWMAWGVPHSECYVIDRATLFQHVEQEELAVPPDHDLPATVLLLARPNDEALAGPREDLLARYWRLLFHAAVHAEVEQRAGGLADVRGRIDAIGRAAFEEARSVLNAEGRLLDATDDAAVYIEFAATFLELRYFAPNLIPVYFPNLADSANVDAVLAADVEGVALFGRTRLAGTADPKPRTDDQSDESLAYFNQLTGAARRADRSGDTVEAAILFTRAARVAPAALTGPAETAARDHVFTLIDRLRTALGLSDAETAAWRDVLPTLLDKADQGARPVEAALLFDLQRTCLEHEQTTYALDPIEWLLSGGRRPIRRPLDSQRFVRIPAHLRSAIRRLASARLSDADRQALAGLLRDALARAEGRLRDRFRPVMANALSDAGLRPRSPAEEAAFAKTVEQLLDRVSSAGFLGFADVRDAIAGGEMKLPDLSGPHALFHGDPLVRLDRRLGTLMDGVYRPAESYTQALERATSVLAGTEVGRWVSLNVLFAFGTAFLLAQFVWLLVSERQAGHEADAAAKWNAFMQGWNREWWFHAGWVTLGLAVLCVVRSARVRAFLWDCARPVAHALRFLFWALPARVWQSDWVRELRHSPAARAVVHYVAKPLLLTAIAWSFSERLREFPGPALATIACAFALTNSRFGGAAETLLAAAAERLVRTIRHAPGLVRWIGHAFREMVAALDWLLARVDDWLRLRGPGGPFAIACRVVARIAWTPFAFLFRFYTVVLVEPMVNPLKLPVTLVFAKFVYPLLAVLGLFTFEMSWGSGGVPTVQVSAAGMDELATWMPYWAAFMIVVGTFWLLPDACTYLFWEMRENWRLYGANRPTRLRPARFGPHGETLAGLLQPSFHSGTVPRLFARLRAAEQTAARTDVWRDVRTLRRSMQEIEDAVRKFVDREFIALLNGPGAAGPLRVGRVLLASNRFRIEIVAGDAGPPAWLEWEDRFGLLVASLQPAGFLAESPALVRRYEWALTYLYTRAGIELVREQITAALPERAAHYDVVPTGLLVWHDSREARPRLYDLSTPDEEIPPRDPETRKVEDGPSLPSNRLVFGNRPLSWRTWTQTWEQLLTAGEQATKAPPESPALITPRRETAGGQTAAGG